MNDRNNFSDRTVSNQIMDGANCRGTSSSSGVEIDTGKFSKRARLTNGTLRIEDLTGEVRHYLDKIGEISSQVDSLELIRPSTEGFWIFQLFKTLNSLRLEQCDTLSSQFLQYAANVRSLHVASVRYLAPASAFIMQNWNLHELKLSMIGYVPNTFWEEFTKQGFPGAQCLSVLSLDGLNVDHIFLSKYLHRLNALRELSFQNVSSNYDLHEVLYLGGLQNLRKLRFQNVRLSWLPRGFNRLEQLKSLELYNVPLQQLDIYGSQRRRATRKNAPPFDKDGSGADVPVTEPLDVEVLARLERLLLSNTQIRSLPDTSQPLSLRELIIRDTNLTVLPTCYLTDSLEILNISGTRLETLPSNALPGKLRNLRELHISENSVAALPDNYYTKSLQVLNLSKSEVSSLNADKFRFLTSLESLDISYTKISSLPALRERDREPGCVRSLRELRLRGSDIRALPAWAARCPNLKLLDLRELSMEKAKTLTEFFKREDYTIDSDCSADVERIRSDTQRRLCRVYTAGLHIPDMDPSLIKKDYVELLRYYLREEYRRPFHRGNIMILGDENAGKSQVAERLTDIPLKDWRNGYGFHVTDEPYALEHLLEVAGLPREKRLESDTRVRFIRLSGSFSAQILHSVFMTEHALYLIVLNGEHLEEVPQRARYWARMVEVYAPHSRVIFVIMERGGVMKRFPVSLLTQDIWFDAAAESVCLNLSNPETENSLSLLCQSIARRIPELLLYGFPLPPEWIQAIRYFERLLEARLEMDGTDFQRILDYALRINEKPDIKQNIGELIERYLLGFMERTAGQMLSVVQTSERHSSLTTAQLRWLEKTELPSSDSVTLYQTEWLAEGLYRLLEYAQKREGWVNARRFWEWMTDVSDRKYSMKQVRFLLKFCHEDALCYLYDKTEEIWSFPYFALWKNDTAPQFLEKSLMKYQRNGRAEAYRISCPLLSRKMLSEFSVRIICRFHADRKKYCGGQEGFFVEMNGCAILTQGLVGHDTELQIRFYRNRVLSEEQFEDVIQAAFEEWERCVSKLPEYLKRKFDILVDRFSSGRTDIRFREKESISIQNLNGYVNAGRDEYFSGILNRQFSLDSFFFPRSLESAGEAEDGINNV